MRTTRQDISLTTEGMLRFRVPVSQGGLSAHAHGRMGLTVAEAFTDVRCGAPSPRSQKGDWVGVVAAAPGFQRAVRTEPWAV